MLISPTEDKEGLLLTFGSPANPRHRAHVSELFPAPAKHVQTLSESAETSQVPLDCVHKDWGALDAPLGAKIRFRRGLGLKVASL